MLGSQGADVFEATSRRQAVVRQLPVSICLCLSKLFLVYSLGRLDAGRDLQAFYHWIYIL